MNIFLSWSGERSRAVAVSLRDWLPLILQYTRPYVSAKDIHKGTRWSVDVATTLDEANHGIVCLFPENLTEDWILFEAGALSKALKSSSLWTFLGGDLQPKDVTGPLSQFQHTVAEEEDVLKLLESINAAAGEDAIDNEGLRFLFEKLWPELEGEIKGATAIAVDATVAPKRDSDAVLAEVLDVVRDTAKGVAEFAGGEERNWHRFQEFLIRVHVQPTQDEALIDAFRQRCQEHPLLRGSFRSMGSGGTGVGPDGEGTLWDHLQFQSYRPLSRAALLEVGKEVGLEVIHVAYDVRDVSR